MTETAQYMVCRLIEVTYKFLLNLDVKNPDKVCFYAPYMHEGIKVFVNPTDAIAYRDKMNAGLNAPHDNGDGSFTIENTPASDYVVIDLETRQTIKEA